MRPVDLPRNLLAVITALRRCVLAAIVVSSIAAVAHPAAASDFTQYQANVRHDGRVQEVGLDPPFTREWSRRMNAPGYPIIADGHVFVIGPDSTGTGSVLRAIDLSTGAQVWRKLIGDAAFLTYDSGRLFVIDRPGILLALDASTGARVWADALTPQYFFTSPPTASEGTVYLTGSGQDGTLYAISEADGSILWTADDVIGDGSAPTLSPTRVFEAFTCSLAEAFRRIDGKKLWQTHPSCLGGGGATTVLHRGLIYTRDRTENDIFDAADGSLVGTYDVSAIPTFDDGSMYALVNGRLTATDLATGTARWSRAFDGGLVSNPLIVNRWVVEASSLGRIAAFNRSNGRVEWSARVPPVAASVDLQLGQPLTGLGAGNGYLIVPTKHRLIAFRGAGVTTP